MLFPELAIAPGSLTGIAKLASQGELLASKKRVEYRDLPTRRFIGRASGNRVPFDWTINPYRGCEFGCKYCYARYTHEFMEKPDPEQFEREIFAKQFDPREFRRELSRIPRSQVICIGTATDPYQPAERRFEVTRKILGVLAEDRGRTLCVTTKSDLVGRDVDLLGRIAKSNVLHVSMTITTTDEHLARALEPYAPRPALRLDAIERLSSAGIRVAVLCSPIMPLINDSNPSIESVAKAASCAGATYLSGNVLFLKPCAQKAFFPFLEQHFPALVRKYRERYLRHAYLDPAFSERILLRLHAIRERFGLTHRSFAYQPEHWAGEPQLELFNLPS